MGMITVPEHGEYTLTLREPSVNPCYSMRPDGPHDHGRRPHRRLRRGDALRRQGSGPRHGLAHRAGCRGGRRRGHGVAPHRSRGGERARQRRRGVAAGGDVVVQEDRLDAPGPRGRRDRRAPRGHGRAERRHLPRVPVRGPCRARPRAVGRRRRDGACRGRDPVRERPAARLGPARRGARGRRGPRRTPGAARGDDRGGGRRDGRRSRHDRRVLSDARRHADRPRRCPAPGTGVRLRASARSSRAARADQGRRLRPARSVRLALEGGGVVKNPILGVTMGDPAGVGPEIIVRAAAEPEVQRTSRPVVIGAASTLTEAAALAGSPLRLHGVTRVADCRWPPGTLEVLDLANVDMATLPRARGSAAAGRAAYAYIETAVDLAKTGAIHGIVTAPINKEALAAAGMTHSGHTEILASLSGTRDLAMLLMGDELRVIHVTTHVALRRVPELVTRERVLRTIELAQRTLERLGIPRGRIAVAGLNPHAGEDGLFGHEEKTAIGPAVEAAPGKGLNVTGPLPADTLFSRARLRGMDLSGWDSSLWRLAYRHKSS